MKTFREFLLICEKLEIKIFKENFTISLVEGRYQNEHAFRHIFNQMRGSKSWKKAAELMKQGKEEEAIRYMKISAAKMRERLENAADNPNDPLNFSNITSRDFKSGKTASDENSYYSVADSVIDAVAFSAKERRFRAAITSPILLGKRIAPTGKDVVVLTKAAIEAGAKSGTSKADNVIFDPRNKKYYVGISNKEDKAQIGSAEPGDFRAASKAAALRYARTQVPIGSENWQERRKEISRDIEKRASEIAEYGERQRVPISQSAGNKDLVQKAQVTLNNLYKDHPGFDYHLTQSFATGQGRFAGSETKDRNVRGTADVMVHTPNPETVDKKDPEVGPISLLQSIIGRAAKGKGTLGKRDPKTGEYPDTAKKRPGNIKFDTDLPLKGQEPKSNKAQPEQGPITKSQFDRRARLSDLESKGVRSRRDEIVAAERERINREREAQQAAEAETQKALSKAEKNLEVANIKAQNASVPIDPDTGEPIPARFRATAIQNMAADPTSRTAKINNARREKSQSIITKAQSEYDNAAASHQETQSTLDAIQQNKQPQQQTPPSEQQPQQSAATTTPSEPTQPQQQTQPPQQTPAQEQQPQQQPEPSGPKTAAQQAAELGLTGDGHGRWYDNKGNVAAETEGDILKRTAPLKPKPKNTGTAERMDAAGKKLGLPDS